MFCPACGVQNEEGSVFCANCGTKFSNSQHQSESYENTQYQNTPQKPQYTDNQIYGRDSALYQNNTPQSNKQQSYRQQPETYGGSQYGQPRPQPYGDYPVEDRISPLIFVLSFFIFPLGLILYFANKRQKPRSAKNLLIVTIMGFFIFFVLNS